MANTLIPSRQQYGMFVRNLCHLPEDFMRSMCSRIDLAHDMGETPEMLADELKLRYSLRGPNRTKTPSELAVRTIRSALPRMMGR